MRNGVLRLGALAALVLAGGCAVAPPQPAPQEAAAGRCDNARPFTDGALRATLWLRASSEYRASAEGIYRSAAASLARALADPGWSAEPKQTEGFASLPPAVVMDIDETVLDNSAAQARMIQQGTCPAEFAAAWDAWLAERVASAIPGAAEFIRVARATKDSQGRAVRVFLITNRECAPRPGAADPCPQEADTLANLRALGLDAPTLADDLMVKGERPEWVSEKESRRLAVAKDYRILLNVGDDLADFLAGVRRGTPAERERARCAHGSWWGERWFVIPNPMYGSWQQVLGPDLDAALAALPVARRDCGAQGPPSVTRP